VHIYLLYFGAGIDVPYPSWADAAYFGSALSFVVGAYFLAKSVGFGIGPKSKRFSIVPIVVPIVIIGISAFVFLYNHQYDTSQPLTVFLDFGYPVVEAIYISLALIAYLSSAKLLGGLMKSAILILIVGLIVQYCADFSFLYGSSRGTFILGGFLIYSTCVHTLSQGHQ